MALKYMLCLGLGICLSMPLMARESNSGGVTGVGNGGDIHAAQFKTLADEVVAALLDKGLYDVAGISVEVFAKTVAAAQIESTSKDLFLEGRRVDAINYPEQQKIILSLRYWSTYPNPALRYRLVVHEILGLMGYLDVGYTRSAQILLAADVSQSRALRGLGACVQLLPERMADVSTKWFWLGAEECWIEDQPLFGNVYQNDAADRFLRMQAFYGKEAQADWVIEKFRLFARSDGSQRVEQPASLVVAEILEKWVPEPSPDFDSLAAVERAASQVKSLSFYEFSFALENLFFSAESISFEAHQALYRELRQAALKDFLLEALQSLGDQYKRPVYQWTIDLGSARKKIEVFFYSERVLVIEMARPRY